MQGIQQVMGFIYRQTHSRTHKPMQHAHATEQPHGAAIEWVKLRQIHQNRMREKMDIPQSKLCAVCF
jgi:hypothetical protein